LQGWPRRLHGTASMSASRRSAAQTVCRSTRWSASTWPFSAPSIRCRPLLRRLLHRTHCRPQLWRRSLQPSWRQRRRRRQFGRCRQCCWLHRALRRRGWCCRARLQRPSPTRPGPAVLLSGRRSRLSRHRGRHRGHHSGPAPRQAALRKPWLGRPRCLQPRLCHGGSWRRWPRRQRTAPRHRPLASPCPRQWSGHRPPRPEWCRAPGWWPPRRPRSRGQRTSTPRQG